MTHAAARHRDLDRRLGNRLGEPGHALVRSRDRLKDIRTMTAPQAKVLFATLTEQVSGRGNTYLRGWAGTSNLVAFQGEPDEQGRPTWNLYLVERQQREGSQAPVLTPQGRETDAASTTTPPTTGARPGDRYKASRPESARARQERVSAEIARGHGVSGDQDLNDDLPF